MFPHRSHASLILGGALSAALLSGCPNAGTQPPVTPATTTSPAPSASATTPTGEASQAPVGASVAPSSTPSTTPLESTTLRGKVYDESGATVNGASVKVRSLNTANPFETTVDVSSGAYVANGVPAGVQLEVTATKAGWTSRTRVTTLLPLSSTQANIVNFGGPTTDADDAEGARYFISDYPEIVSAVATRTDAKLTYVVRLSEPLDTTNQRLLENAFSVSTPNPNGGFIVLKKGSTFLDDRVIAKMTWDPTGTTLTYEMEAPLLAQGTDEQKYTLTFSRGTSDEQIEDATGKRLGFLNTAPDSLYSEAFKLSTPTSPASGSAEDLWKATHTGTASFDVPEDDTKPTLVSVSGSPISNDGDKFRFSLTFSEPMKVYPDADGFNASALEKGNYRFALSEDDVKGVDMDATLGAQVTDAPSAEAALAAESVFQFDPADMTVTFSNADPKVIHVTVPRSHVPAAAKAFKVSVEGVKDPAGNLVATGNEVASDQTADNIKMGAI